MTKPHRQRYGFGSFIKKITRPVKKVAKKVLKSPLGKAALIGGGLYGLGGLQSLGGSGMFKAGQGLQRFRNLGNIFSRGNLLSQLVRKEGGKGSLSLGKLGLAGLLGAGVTMPFLGGDDEEEQVVDDWPGVGNLRAQGRDYYRAATPDYINSPFMVPKEFVKSDYYAADGGLARLANGGGVAEAQAEQMLKMEYQKYRNQGGTMSYQQFKMTVLKQAQGQGPMAQEHLQTAAQGGRIGLLGGGPVPGSTVPGYTTPVGYNKFDYRTGGVPVRVGRAEGGLMSLGGMEKDYRQEGGFVPLGKEEKADDVPARLSKNEFVFTADAVKAAGRGDIDAGAEVMQNVMTNLEEGGEISEESQGAQGMYNQQQMLQSRMA